MNEKAENAAEDREHFEALRNQTQSLILATVDGDAAPRASYAPFVMHSGAFYIYLSRLSEHTRDLLHNPAVSVMLIEDEAAASQLFARKRLIYACHARAVDRGDAGHDAILQILTDRFGSVMKLLQTLPDFVLFRLEPASGRFVTGFGRAYDLRGEALDELVQLGPDDVNPGGPEQRDDA